ncbi:MAG: regulatory protein RecX [Flavitalea sp.]
MAFKQRSTPEQAFQKLKHFCSYQERCHFEVKEKLYSLGLWKKDVETILSQLIEAEYLNEERFAEQFAGGKFRMKQWGRVKIRYELKQKQVSEYCIKKAMKIIPEADYLKTIKQCLNKKLALVKGEKNHLIKKRKILDYLLQKGYERDLVMSLINDL